MRRLLPPLVLTLVTTAIGYISLAITPFPGLRQMAVFSIAGLVIAWLTVVFWFPALLRSGTMNNLALTRRYAASLEHWPVVSRHRTTLLTAMALGIFVFYGWSKLDVQ